MINTIFCDIKSYFLITLFLYYSQFTVGSNPIWSNNMDISNRTFILNYSGIFNRWAHFRVPLLPRESLSKIEIVYYGAFTTHGLNVVKWICIPKNLSRRKIGDWRFRVCYGSGTSLYLLKDTKSITVKSLVGA